MNECPKCGAALAEDYKTFCPECGAEVADTPEVAGGSGASSTDGATIDGATARSGATPSPATPTAGQDAASPSPTPSMHTAGIPPVRGVHGFRFAGHSRGRVIAYLWTAATLIVLAAIGTGIYYLVEALKG